jgi:hypothetical protein
MPQKSKTAKQKATGIAKACGSRHPSRTSDSVLLPDAEINDTTPKTSPSPHLEITTDLDNEEINEGIALEGPKDSPLELDGSRDYLDLSPVGALQLYI